jgi:hypothetical protein
VSLHFKYPQQHHAAVMLTSAEVINCSLSARVDNQSQDGMLAAITCCCVQKLARQDLCMPNKRGLQKWQKWLNLYAKAQQAL